MSELAQRLFTLIKGYGPIYFSDLWDRLDVEAGFQELEAALTELLDAGQIRQIDDTFAFEAAEQQSRQVMSLPAERKES